MSTINSPNMLLPIPTVGNEIGPNYAFDVNASLTIVDQHDHSSGSGVQVTPAGININSALTFANNLATNLAASVYISQSSQAVIQATYVKGVDLYYRDGNNNEIRLTIGGSIVGTAGSISGLPSGTAGVNFSGGVFTFSASTNTPANIQAGSILLGNNVALSKYLTLAPPDAMGSNFTITLPSLPGSQSILTIDNSGAMATPVVYPIPTAGIAALSITTSLIAAQAVTAAKVANATITTTQIASLTILGSNLANQTITATQIADSTVTGDQMTARNVYRTGSCGNFNLAGGFGATAITNLSESVSVNANKSMWMRLEAAFMGSPAWTAGTGATLTFLRDGVVQYTYQIDQSIPVSALSATIASGDSSAHTYSVKVDPQGSNFDMQNAVLVISQI